MATINLLTSKIYNRIAAGEVVERPSSVVKELVENSIDAGAKNIIVDIKNGGISSITISDDGCGIEKEELNKALLPHATSKINVLDDLYNISTLGFRGEALASIASVSKISIASKPVAQEFGAMIYAEGGEVEQITDYPASNGTEICVKNLFYNTPAREKFLKAPKSEENDVTVTMARFILGNCDIAFKYFADGKLILQSFGDGLESAFVCVYGAHTVNDCFYIETEKNGIKINGYIGKHYFTKGNRSYQTVFLNGRYVQNQTLSSSIANAYAPYLMKRQYPFYVLNVQMPSDAVDCNVHPNKIDVRFLNNQIVYGALYSVISKVLDGSEKALDIIAKDEQNNSKDNANYVTHNAFIKETFEFDKLIFADSGDSAKNTLNDNKNDNVEDIFAQNKLYLQQLEEQRNAQNNIEKNTVVQQEIAIAKELKLVGQALNAFVLLEDGENLYLIDQHAAHERLLFDKLNKQIKENSLNVQPLLLPYILNLNSFEADYLSQKLNVLNEMGIEVAEFGLNTFKISSVPVVLGDIDLKLFFDELLSDLTGLKSITLNDLLKEKIAQKACKAAIKAGDKLSQANIVSLLEMLNGNLGLKCPHGRPIAIKITRTEIDKWFKRIV